jgi:hypothetical protein
MSYGDNAITKELPKIEEVKELLPLKGYSQYLVSPSLGKIYNKEKGKWLLVNAKGVGDKGYLLTKLKHDDGKSVPLYEHECVYAAMWGDEPKSWRKYGEKLEIDHIDGNVKNNCIENLILGTSSDNKKNRSYDVEKNYLTLENAQIVREEFSIWEGSKLGFYEAMSNRFNVTKRTIQNAVLGVTYKVESND